MISEDEAVRLEEEGQRELEEYNKQKTNSFFKIPVFQPTAAAAMMYNIQNHHQQQHQQQVKKLENESTDDNANRSYLNPFNYISFFDSATTRETNSKISSQLIAQVLKKEAEAPSKKSFKLFPYVCLRCKKETVICSSSTQYDVDDLIQFEIQTPSIATNSNQTNNNEDLLLNDNLIANEPSQSNYSDSFIV